MLLKLLNKLYLTKLIVVFDDRFYMKEKSEIGEHFKTESSFMNQYHLD